MSLRLQILTLSYSFSYGIFFSFLLTINYKLIYNNKKYIKYLATILFVLINVLIYFLLLKKINNAIIHPYFLFVFILGVITERATSKLVAKHFKKWYNFNMRW